MTSKPPPSKEVKPIPSPPKPAPARKPNVFENVRDRTLDTIDDVSLHFRRQFGSSPKRIGKKQVVVLGTGWAAHSFIKVIDEEAYDVTLVSPRNFYFFTPLLAATAVGTIEFRSVVDPIRRANPFVNFYEGVATGIDLDRSEIECVPINRRADSTASEVDHTDVAAPFRVRYDYLLVTVGEKAGTFGVPGVRENAHFLKEISDSIRLRNSIIGAFEEAALPLPSMTDAERRDKLHFVVVGGGPTGCEFAGELSDFVINDLRVKYASLLPLVRVTLLQSRDSILTSFESNLQDRALDNFANRSIDVLLKARVANVTKDVITLGDGREIRYGVLVWAAGNSPRDLTKTIIDAVNVKAGLRSVGGVLEKGEGDVTSAPQPNERKLTVDDWLRVRGTENVFALGDCSYLPAGPLPATAQVAGQQGAYMARAFRKLQKSGVEREWTQAVKPFRFLSLGAMAYIGDTKALLQLEAGPDGNNIALSGFISYLLWASTYAVKQVATRNRILVLFDWFKTKVFGRDVSQF